MKTRVLNFGFLAFVAAACFGPGNILSLVLIALAPGTSVGGDLFQDNGVFTPTVTKDSVDTARSLAYPGGELPRPGVIRTDRQGHHQSWNTQATTEPAKCHYTIALKEPMALGTILLVGQYEVSFLRPDADADPNRDASWTNVRYPGEAGREVRAVPLPCGTVTTAILYDFVVPGTPDSAKLAFSSPWRTVYVDRVTVLRDATIAVDRGPTSFTLEASVPLKSIHLAPRATLVIRGDVGRVHSDQTGTRAVSREYWSNKNTNITADVPSEAQLQPNLWGTFRFEAP